MSNKDVKNEHSLTRLGGSSQDFLDSKENPEHCGLNDEQNTKPNNRKSERSRAKGIVVLSRFDKPIVTNLCDIGLVGVSFVCNDEEDVIEVEFKMDILIFDNLNDFEYFIGSVRGRIRTKIVVFDPKSNAAFWRFGVEFLELNPLKLKMLQACCDRTLG